MNTTRSLRLAALVVVLLIALALGFVTRRFALEPETPFGLASALPPIVVTPLTLLVTY
jgi:hypothetical protein